TNVPNQDFGNFQLITISGRKFDDLDGNGSDNGGTDPGLGGVTIQLNKDANNKGLNDDPVFATQVTAAGTGAHAFANPGQGRGFVQEVTPAGSIRTAGPAFYTVVASSGTNVPNENFGNFKPITISGRTANDLNADGNIAADPGQGGVTIQ